MSTTPTVDEEAGPDTLRGHVKSPLEALLRVTRTLTGWRTDAEQLGQDVRVPDRRWDIAVVGGGTAGIVASRTAASLGARVLLIERARTGGDCLWTGCVPSKALLSAARHAVDVRRAHGLGVHAPVPSVDFADVMAHVQGAIAAIEPEDSPETLRGAGVHVMAGEARFTGPGRLEVGGRCVSFARAVVTTGAKPTVPPVPGLRAARPLTSDTVWDLDALPDRLVVLGGRLYWLRAWAGFRPDRSTGHDRRGRYPDPAWRGSGGSRHRACRSGR